MKAKELAELLMKNPDSEVYLESFDCYEGDGYYSTEKITNLITTPSGVFIESTHVDDYSIQSPSKCPEIGLFKLVLENGIVIDYTEEDYDKSNSGMFISSYNDYFSFYGVDSCVIINVCSTETFADWHGETDVYDVSFVEKVLVLVSFDDMWNETWEEMTFDDAVLYYKNLMSEN